MTLALLPPTLHAGTNDLTTALQRGLFEEEANRNLDSAIQAYQSVAGQFDKDRKLAATAIFRLGECYRKQGNTNDAAAQYDRIVREFSDQSALLTLCRQNLAALGAAPQAPATTVVSTAARQEQKRLLAEEIKLVEKKLEEEKRKVAVGAMPSGDLLATEREILELRRQLAGLDAGQPAPSGAVAGATAAEAAEAEAEAAALKAQMDRLLALEPQQRRIAVQQDFSNPVLTELMQKLAAAEQNLAALRKELGEQHTEVQKSKALLETTSQQIDAQVKGVLDGLEAKRKVAQARAAALAQAEPAGVKAQASGPGAVPATATEAEEVRRIQALIRDSPDLINAREAQTGTTPLHRAAQAGQLTVAQFLLANGADTEAKAQNSGGGTPLHYAATAGHKAMVELLLSKKASVRAADNGGATPLHVAARAGYRSIVEVLLANGADVNGKADSGTPLELASAHGFKAVAELLMASGADVNAAPASVRTGQGIFTGTPLCIAVQRGDLALAELLIAKRAKVDADDGVGRTPLSYAVQDGQDALVKLLLGAHADPNAGSLDLPVSAAAFFGRIPALQALLGAGADPNTNCKVNWEVQTLGTRYPQGGSFTPLFLAVNRHYPEAVKLLIQAKADPNGLGPTGSPILFEALSDTPTLKALLEGGADPNVRDKEGTSPLMRAVWNRDQAGVELLLAHRADANFAAKGGWTALQAAVASETKGAIAQLLLKNGADVNARNDSGVTALHVAVERGNGEMVALLLENKADPNARDKAGQTPLDAAKSRQQPGAFVANPSPFRPGPTPAPTVPAGSIPDLLRQHGAQEDLPRMDQIEIRRPSANYSETVFRKGTNDYNRFSLLELIAAHYGFVSTKTGFGLAEENFDMFVSNRPGLFTRVGSLKFPDLKNVVIRRPTADGRSRSEIRTDLNTILDLGAPGSDLQLKWGDVVEIPEADHPISAAWQGLPRGDLVTLTNRLARQVQLTVKGQTTNLVLVPQAFKPNERELRYSSAGARTTVPSFFLEPVLSSSGMLRASSDLSRVKVTRQDRATGQTYQLIVDCSHPDSPPDLWLRDGDKIEVPEKP